MSDFPQPDGLDIAIAVERLVPQAAFGTARKTDIDTDDYAALERTWYDSRPIPTIGQLTAAHNAYHAEKIQAQLDRDERRDNILLRRTFATIPEIGEIQSITSLVDAKQVLLQMRAVLTYFDAIMDSLKDDSGLFD